MQHSESLMHGEYEYVVHFTHPKGLPVKCNHDLFNEQFMHYTNRFFFLESIFSFIPLCPVMSYLDTALDKKLKEIRCISRIIE